MSPMAPPAAPPASSSVPGEPRTAGARWAPRLAFLGLLLGMLATLPSFVHGWYDPTNDGAMYVLTTRSVLAGEGYSMLGIPFRIRPPGFTYLLAPLVAWRGTDFHAIHLFVSAWGIAGCLLLFHWAQARIGWLLAAAVAALVWCNPGYQLLCNQPMSDVPGTALLLASLLLERWADRRPSWKRDAAFGALVSLGAYVRSINVLFVPAVLGMRLVRRLVGPRGEGEPRSWRSLGAGALAMLLATLAVQLPWSVRNAAVAPEPPADQTLLYSYGTAFWHADMGDPASPRLTWSDVFDRMPQRGGQALGVLGNRMKERTGGAAQDAPYAFVFLAGVLVVLLKRRESAELFVAGTLLLISVYFGFAPRLLLPILLLSLVATTEALRDLVALLARPLRRADAPDPDALPRRVGGSVALVAVLGLLAFDLEPRKGWEKIEEQHGRLTEICRRFALKVDEEDVLASYRAWHYAVLMERPIYALEFVLKRHTDPETRQVDPRPMEEMIDKYGIEKVLLSPARAKTDRLFLDYFEQRYGPQRDPLARVYDVR